MTNGTMMQYFHWYIRPEDELWQKVAADAEHLSSLGINAVWLPPAFKGKEGGDANGYDVYDIFDMGEFDQKGSVRTRYGTKQQYIDAVNKLHEKGVHVYGDVVLNHKAGADEIERIKVIRVDPDDRTKFIGEPLDIDGYTKFNFPGRKGKYSSFVWNYTCFSGIDYAADLQENSIFSIFNDHGFDWDEIIDDEKGNYDYLMFNDIEFRNESVRNELKYWGEWYLQQASIDGLRLDAVKHIPYKFYNEWLDHMRTIKPDLFVVGEYWAPGALPLLLKYIEATDGRMSLFDSSLHTNLHRASLAGNDYDLSTILNDTLVQVLPHLAVTVVDNHDTQPLQSLEAPVEHWFKPHAYALILLREGGYPCLFYPDLYGGHYVDKGRDGQDHEIFLNKVDHIEKLLASRNLYAYGGQRDYFDHPNCVGWTREGIEDRPDSGCAVLLSNGDESFKTMDVGQQHAGKTFIDFLGTRQEKVVIDEAGFGTFLVNAGSISVWIIE